MLVTKIHVIWKNIFLILTTFWLFSCGVEPKQTINNSSVSGTRYATCTEARIRMTVRPGPTTQRSILLTREDGGKTTYLSSSIENSSTEKAWQSSNAVRYKGRTPSGDVDTVTFKVPCNTKVLVSQYYPSSVNYGYIYVNSTGISFAGYYPGSSGISFARVQ